MSDTGTGDYSTILYATAGEIATITLNRPEKMNAWTPQMAEELADAFGRANGDASIGAIVLRGAGRGFCAGADMDAVFQTRIDGTDPGNDTAGGSGGMPRGVDWVALMRSSKPTIAVVHGAAVGIGLTMILPVDMIVVTPEAKLGMAFIKVGLVPELASSHLLTQRVGWGAASEMCLTGRIVRGEEAAAIRLADRLVPADELDERVAELAAAFAASPTPQALMVKELLTLIAAETDLHLVQQRESERLLVCWETAEHKEAVAAFKEKRPPKFR